MAGARRGLVLEGGGAKGAYALGCLLALSEQGTTFDAVSGTSVGSLNAAAWSTGKLTESQRFWHGLTLGAVCVPRRPALLAAPLSVVHACLYGYWKCVSLLTHGELLIGAALGTFILVSAGVFIAALFAVEDLGLLDALPATWHVSLVMGAILAILLVWLAILFPLVALVPAAFRRLGFALFRTTPLRRSIDDILGAAEFSIPTFVTLTRRTEIVYPDATPAVLMLPQYLRVDRSSQKRRTELLLASAALPYGLFPEVRLGNTYYVDGGEADNTPIYPLAVFERCTEIVVVHLRPVRGDRGAWERKERERCRDLRYLRQLTKLEATFNRRHARQPERSREFAEWYRRAAERLEEQELPAWPGRFVHIAPDRSLGSFLTGTMNFRAAYSKRLMARGYADARAVIDRELSPRAVLP
jgi:predicted acylesterase/phospholipase RssA